METKQQVADKSALLATKMRFLQKRLRHLRRQKNDSYRLQAEILREVKAIDKDVSALLEQLRPYRIAIAGMISSGKSTFVNKALLSEKLLGASKGRTTKLPMELAYRGDSEKYRVTVEFVDESSLQSLLKFLGQWELRKKRKERPGPDETKEIDAAKVRMKKLFSNVDEVLREIGDLERVAQVSSLLLRKTKTTKSIGSLPLVQEVPSIEKVKEVIAKFSKKPWIWVVQLIRVEGPFEFLPAGVVVVDTPGLGDPDQVTSERTEAQLSAADEVWHLSPSAHSFAVDTEGMAVVRSLTDGGESRTVRVVVTKCRGGLPDDDDHEEEDDEDEDDDEEDNEDEDDEEEAVEDKPPCGDDNNGADNVTARDPVQLVRSNLVAAHRRGRSVASMSTEERTEWEQKLPVIQKRVDAIPLVFTEFSKPMVGVDEVREWLQVLSVARAESLGALEIAFATTVDRLGNLFTQQIIHIPAPCTTTELATWWTAVDNACDQLTAAMNVLPASMSPESYHRMVAINRWARDPAARTRDGSVDWQTGVAIMRKSGHHITAYGTEYDLSLDIVNRYTAYLHPLKECVTALRRAALSLDANDARFATARETLKVEFYQTELRFGFESHQRIEQELQPLYERYSSCDITWDYKGQTVRFFKREDIDEIAERGREDIQRFVEHIIETVKSTYHRLVTPIDVTKSVSPSYTKVLEQVRAITVVPPAVEDEDNVCPISLAPFRDPVSLRCGHCFDRSSLKRMVRASPFSRCPLCRQCPVGAPDTWRSRLDVLVRCSLAVPSAAPSVDWCATMTAAVEMELRREVEDAAAYSAAAEVGKLTASADAMHLGPVAAPPSLVLGPALGPGPVPLPVPVPVPASGSFPNPAPAAAERAILPPPAAHK